MHIQRVLLVLSIILAHGAQAEFEERMRESVFGDRARKAMKGESEPSAPRTPPPIKEDRYEELESHLGIWPEFKEQAVTLANNGESLVEIRVSAPREFSFKFLDKEGGEFSLNFLEIGFFAEGGSAPVYNLFQRYAGLSDEGKFKDQSWPIQKHLNQIYKTSVLFADEITQAAETGAATTNVSPAAKDTLEKLRKNVPSGWMAERRAIYAPLGFYFYNEDIFWKRDYYDHKFQDGEWQFTFHGRESRNLHRETKGVYGLFTEHAARVYARFGQQEIRPCAEGNKPWDSSRTPLKYRDLVASGEWKNWRYSKDAGYVLDGQCTYPTQFRWGLGFETAKMRKANEAKNPLEEAIKARAGGRGNALRDPTGMN